MKSKTYDIINQLLLEYETGVRKNDDITIHEVIGLHEEKGVIFGALEVEYNDYCYLIHFEIGNRWVFPSKNDIKEIENTLFNIIDEEIKKHFKN
ncbi:hypothetical protein SEP9_101 [Staphylococcus phage vB_SepS_SEP9]|uniref:Uncharacterized protein n=1 Tax=Staphylococcus phage vB_SepS_SEP9 TaxID=1434319 RepID=W5RVA5_9CAUD|nr:hypothetical protein SEP9_101 [Staphylococcus phage vB_SepS_SEP9]AHG24022.1 hypothetical protein SEP9_101 [Staphylococcus phage vB_SepS_SEP9]